MSIPPTNTWSAHDSATTRLLAPISGKDIFSISSRRLACADAMYKNMTPTPARISAGAKNESTSKSGKGLSMLSRGSGSAHLRAVGAAVADGCGRCEEESAQVGLFRTAVAVPQYSQDQQYAGYKQHYLTRTSCMRFVSHVLIIND